MRSSIGCTRVTFEYSRVVGPKSNHGGVTLRFGPATEFAFRSSARWPAGDDYTAFVERGVRSALESRGVLDQHDCTLEAITWNDVDSCAVGFERAARAATIGLLES